ncbi:MAG: hypothetical protein ACT4RN_17600 [Pseudonocardia sp.]
MRWLPRDPWARMDRRAGLAAQMVPAQTKRDLAAAVAAARSFEELPDWAQQAILDAERAYDAHTGADQVDLDELPDWARDALRRGESAG